MIFLPRMTAPRAVRSRHRRHAWLSLVCVFPLLSTSLQGQISSDIAAVSPTEAVSGRTLTLRAQLHESGTISQMYLRYRTFASGEFITLEMDLVGSTASAQIPASDVVPPFVEYYIVIQRQDGTVATSPPGETPDPFTAPPGATAQIQVREESDKSGVLLLSPDPHDQLMPEDVVIAVSLQNIDTAVVRSATQVWIDGADVTETAVISGDLAIIVPSNAGIGLSGGSHRVTVRLFDRNGLPVAEPSFVFQVAGTGIRGEVVTSVTGYSGSAQIESRHETVSGTGTWYNRGEVRVRGQLDDWALVANMFVTSDEKSDRQPQNRFFAGVESSWLQAGYGDSYPVYPSLIMNGKRLRGFNGMARAGPQIFMVSAGEVTRGIDGNLLATIPVDSLGAVQAADPTAAYGLIDPNDLTTWGKFSYGTYQRNLLALRTETRLGRTGGIGISILHGQDDIGSIMFGTRPQENLVVGLDFGASFDSRRIEFGGQGAFSAFNTDISSGTFTDEYIDSVYSSSASEIKTVRDVLDNFIIVNDNLRPLSFKELSTIAYEFMMGLNYFHNSLKAKYVFRGSDYTSFGQTFLRTDIQGITLSDRIGLADNQILLTLGFEHLQDNTSNFKAATTKFANFNGALSYFPKKEGPAITVGFGRYMSDNGISTTGPDSLLSIDDADDRVFLQSSYGFEWEANHVAMLNLSTSTRTDKSPRRLDVNNTTAAIRLMSRYAIPLETTIDLSFSFNSLPASPGGTFQQNDYSTVSLGGLYLLADGRLTLEARVSPTIGDVKRTVWDASASYSITSTLSIQMRYTYFANKLTVDDNIWRTTLRYEL